MPGWMLAIFLLIAAAVPAGIYFTASFNGYTYSDYGTGPALSGAPGPVMGVGVVPALLLAGYFATRKFWRNSSKE